MRDKKFTRVTEKYVRINERIRISPLRVIDEDGKQVGIISRDEALRLARSKELDLVEIAPQERPPICKIMNYGKYCYEERQKEKDKKGKRIKVKAIDLGVKIQDHDYLVKLKFAREFLLDGNRLRMRILFKGREIVHHDRGKEIFKRLINDISDISKVEVPPKMEGRQMTMLLAPKKGVKDAKDKVQKCSKE